MEIRETVAGKHGQKLREANRTFEGKQRARVTESMRKEIQGMTGVDILDEGFKESEIGRQVHDLFSGDFSLKSFIKAVESGCKRIREANVAGTIQQFLRAGIQLAANNMYDKVDTSFDGMYTSMPSNKAVELYAFAFRQSFPKFKPFGEEPSQAQIAGADIQVPNRLEMKLMLSIGKDLILFDQSNQVQAQAQQIAENFPIQGDSHAVGVFLSNSPTGSYPVLDANGDPVLASQTGAMAGETTWPYNAAFTNGRGKNRLTNFTAASYETIIQLRALARQQRDPLGHKFVCNMDTIWCGTGLTDAFEILLKSELWPSSGTITSVGAGGVPKTDTTMGVQHATNLLKGKFNLVDSIWLPDTAYGICQAAKGYICQAVQPVKVSVENPMSGGSFLLGGSRYLVDEIKTWEWLEPRYSIEGSDGSA